MTRRLTVLFQRPSLLSALLGWKAIVHAQRVFFFPHQTLSNPHSRSRSHRLALWLIRRLSPTAEVTELPQETIAPSWYQNNLESDRYVEEFFQGIGNSASFRLMRRLLDSEHLDRYYKSSLLPWILSETFFYRTARDLSTQSQMILLPASSDRHRFHRYFLGSEQYRRLIPRTVRGVQAGIDRIGYLVKVLSAWNLVMFLAFTAQPFLRLVRKGWGQEGARAGQIRVDVVMPLIFGFCDERRLMKAGHSDGFFFGEELTPSRVGAYFSSWGFSPEEKARQIEEMRKLGISYFDPKDFRADREFFYEAGRFCLALLKGAFSLSGWLEDSRIAATSAALAREYIQEWLFARLVDFKVSIEYQDYNPAHVVRTIVANRFGRMTVGMHHGNSAATRVLPVMRYAHVNRLCVWGRAFERMCGSHWKGMRLVPIGAYRSDWVLQAQSSQRREDLLRYYDTAFGGIRPLILLLFPSRASYVLESRVKEQLEGLRLLRGVTGQFQIVCRFRLASLMTQWLEAGLKEIVENDPRIVLDKGSLKEGLDLLTTYEWIALSDFIITYSHSTSMIEAAVAGKPCVSFDHMLSGKIVYGSYSPGLILEDRNDLVRWFKQILSGSWNREEPLRRLAQDFSYFSDGRCIDRFRQAVLDAVQEVEGSRRGTSRIGAFARLDEQPVLLAL